MRRACVTVLVGVTFIVGAFIAGTNDSVSSDTCRVDGKRISAAQCEEWADAAWEGLSMEEQADIMATGLHDTQLDQLVIDYRWSLIR